MYVSHADVLNPCVGLRLAPTVFDLPLAENYSKNKGLSYSHTLELLEVFLKSPKFPGLTLTGINPDHGAEDGSTIERFAQDLSRLLSLLPS